MPILRTTTTRKKIAIEMTDTRGVARLTVIGALNAIKHREFLKISDIIHALMEIDEEETFGAIEDYLETKEKPEP